jgi:hypothetical protein
MSQKLCVCVLVLFMCWKAPIFPSYRLFKGFINGFAAVQPMHVLRLEGAVGGVTKRHHKPQKTCTRGQIIGLKALRCDLPCFS